jgi:hypothetical protein
VFFFLVGFRLLQPTLLRSFIRLFSRIYLPFTGSLFPITPFQVHHPFHPLTPLHVSISIHTAYPSYRYRGPLIQARSILGYHIQFSLRLLNFSFFLPSASCTIFLFSLRLLTFPDPPGKLLSKRCIFLAKPFSPSASSMILPWAVLFGVSLLSCCSFSRSSILSSRFLAYCPMPRSPRVRCGRMSPSPQFSSIHLTPSVHIFSSSSSPDCRPGTSCSTYIV